VSSEFGTATSLAEKAPAEASRVHVAGRVARRAESRLRSLQYLVLLAFFCVLLVVVVKLPPRGDANSPPHQTVNAVGMPVAGTHYIQNAYRDAKTPNMVTVILADYRAFDTLGETIVVFAGGIACFFILNNRRRKP
jgi:multicomponent Na+:H+ antiporter subunit B